MHLQEQLTAREKKITLLSHTQAAPGSSWQAGHLGRGNYPGMLEKYGDGPPRKKSSLQPSGRHRAEAGVPRKHSLRIGMPTWKLFGIAQRMKKKKQICSAQGCCEGDTANSKHTTQGLSVLHTSTDWCPLEEELFLTHFLNSHTHVNLLRPGRNTFPWLLLIV